MSEMQTLDEQLNEFVGEPADYDRETGEVREEKPQRRTRSDKGKPRSKHVDAFSTGQPIPGEEPLAPLPATPGVPHVAVAISAITAEIMRIGIGKKHRNSGQGYSFRGIDDIYNVLPEYLVKHGLIILPHVEERTVVERPTRGGGMLVYVNIKMAFDLISTRDGSERRVSSYGEAMDSGDKATNKALSTAYKYMAMQTFCIPTIGIDPEENTYDDEVAGTQPPQPQPTTANNGQQLSAAKNMEQPRTPAGPTQEHVALVLREAARVKAECSRAEQLEWFEGLEPEDRKLLTLAKTRRRSKTQELQS